MPAVRWQKCTYRVDIETRLQPDAEPGSMKVLVVRDNRSKAIFAHTVPVKGADEGGFAGKGIGDDVVWLGYSKVVLKTDNEPAILKLLQESLRDLRVEGIDQVMHENFPEYDPQSNGNAEVGVKLVKGMVRTMGSGLERELDSVCPRGIL